MLGYTHEVWRLTNWGGHEHVATHRSRFAARCHAWCVRGFLLSP